MTLRFKVADLKREIVALEQIAANFLAPGGTSVLRQVSSALDSIALRHSTTPIRWTIEESNPLLTQQSRGEYAPDSEGGLMVYGEISFVWELIPVRTGGNQHGACSNVELAGLASTRVRVLEGNPHEPSSGHEIAQWRMEVGDPNSPGTHFHVQVLGHEIEPPFPKDLDVPRLPGLIFSPFSCAEYLLGELFQDRWPRHMSRENGGSRLWNGIQSDRLSRQLRWHQDQVASSSGSPWIAIKLAKPPAELFL